MKRHRYQSLCSFARFTGLAVGLGICLGTTTSCDTAHNETNSSSRFSKKDTIDRIKAGDTLKVQVQLLNKDLQKATRVDITFDCVVKNVMTEAPLDSTKSMCRLKDKNGYVVLDIPTTTDFCPGIWHISKLDFQSAAGHTELVEGKDFSGQPVEIANTDHPADQNIGLAIMNVRSDPATEPAPTP